MNILPVSSYKNGAQLRDFVSHSKGHHFIRSYTMKFIFVQFSFALSFVFFCVHGHENLWGNCPKVPPMSDIDVDKV